MNVKVAALVFCVLLICLSSASATTYTSHYQTYSEVESYYYHSCYYYSCGYTCYYSWWWWWWWYPYSCYYSSTCYTCYPVWRSRTVTRRRCQSDWTGPNCNIPYCTPACTGGNTCVSEGSGKPTCKCLTVGESKCKAVECTTPKRSCYPGTCGGNQRCICPPEFTGDNCEIMLKTPQISRCHAKLFSGNQEAEVAMGNCAVEGHDPQITWVSKESLSRIEASYDTDYLYPYEPVLATETRHIKDAKFGVDSTKATVTLTRPTGAPITIDVSNCKTAGTGAPQQHIDCSRRSTLFSELGITSLPTNTTLQVTVSSQLGGYKILKTDSRETITGRNISERVVLFKVDAKPPVHCRQDKTCQDPPIAVRLDAIKNPIVDFNFTNWFDHESGIQNYKIEIYELLKSTSGIEPILQRAQHPKDTLSTDGNINTKRYTFPAPGVYSVELTVSDYANNTSKARKIMFYDNKNHMEIKKEQLFVVEQASKESGYRWITDGPRNDNGVSRLKLSWKGRYSNMKHVQEGWLSRVPQWTSPKDIDDDLTGGGGTRTIHQIANANGTAFYKLAFIVDKQGGFDLSPTEFEEGVNFTNTKDRLPQSTWLSLTSDVVDKEIFMPALTGSDTVVIWMRAYDAVGYHVEDQILVRFDTSEPELEANSPAVLQPNSPDQYHSRILIKATDMESGIAEVRYYIRDASLNANITSGNAKVETLKRSGATNRRRRSAVCKPDTDTTCYCINGGECFLKEIVVEIDHCDIDKHYADDKTMEFHYVVVNQAGKSVSPRAPLNLKFDGGKPVCRSVPVFTAGVILAIAIGLLVLMVLVILVVFMILRWKQDKHPLPDRVRTFATSVRQKITNTEKVLDSEGHVIYRSKTRRGRQTEDDDDIYVDGSDPGGWRVNRDQVEVAETLAEGRFAVVKKAHLKKGGKTTTVAMKYLPSGASESDRSLLKAKIAFHGNKVPPHDNIVRLIGVLDEGPVMLLEFCDMTLKDWLSKVSKVDTDALENMLNFTMHIASGMEHLHSKLIVHRRLAMRNVLLKNDGMNGLVAKLIGFGSFNDVGSDDGAAEATANVAVPLKWLSPETLESVGRGKAVYTQKSDVWAYGVTIWEIYSLGATPYSGKKSAEVEGLLKTGYRMPKPDECPPELFDGVVVPCWNAAAKKRPDFRNILKQIREFRSGGGEPQEGYYAVEGKSKTYDNPKERTTDYVAGRRAKENPYGAKDELYDDARR